jgi:hypothetical protein
LREVLRGQLTDKFGEVPCEIVHRIEAAGEAEVRVWLGRILEAKTLEN